MLQPDEALKQHAVFLIEWWWAAIMCNSLWMLSISIAKKDTFSIVGSFLNATAETIKG